MSCATPVFTHAHGSRVSIASIRLCDSVYDSVRLTSDLLLINSRRGIIMDYLCGKFGGFCFSRFGFYCLTETAETKNPPNLAQIARHNTSPTN